MGRGRFRKRRKSKGISVKELLRKVGRRILGPARAPRASYATWEEAAAACGEGYLCQELADVVAWKTAQVVSGKAPEPALSATEAIVALCARETRERQMGKWLGKFRVVDIGGGCGLHRFKLRGHVPAGTQWVVIETSAMNRAAAQMQAVTEALIQPLRSLGLAEGSWDLALLSGSLQFAADPKALLRELAAARPARIVFGRLFLTDGPTRCEAQRSRLSWNGAITQLPPGVQDREVLYPRTVLNRDEFMEAMRGAYRCALHWNEGTDGQGFLFEIRD